eukprot:535447-Rhodomonas_salina.1
MFGRQPQIFGSVPPNVSGHEQDLCDGLPVRLKQRLAHLRDLLDHHASGLCTPCFRMLCTLCFRMLQCEEELAVGRAGTQPPDAFNARDNDAADSMM